MNQQIQFTLVSLGALLIGIAPLRSQQAEDSNYPPIIEDAQTEVYKSVDGFDLNMWIFTPNDHDITHPVPGIVFFCGSGWRGGNPIQFEKHCRYLADRGMVAMMADYRVSRRHGTTADRCLADGKSAVRWMRAAAKRLGIDPNKIVSAGGSAGGQVAAGLALIEAHNEPSDDLSISTEPNALVLFNPSLVLASIPGKFTNSEEREARLAERLGVDPITLSPYHFLNGYLAPTIIFHGLKDDVAPYKTVKVFTDRMRKLGNRCELYGYKEAGHGFYNQSVANGAAWADTIHRMDKFLVSLGYLEGPPNVIKH